MQQLSERIMSREETYYVRYTVALIAEFAKRFSTSKTAAYNYLKDFKGLDYLKEYYDVLHTLSFEEAIYALAKVCQRNGGQLQYKEQ